MYKQLPFLPTGKLFTKSIMYKNIMKYGFTLVFLQMVLGLNAQFSVSIVIDQDLCPGISNAQLRVVMDGGTAPYSITWSTGDLVESITNVGAGTYTVVVVDDEGLQDNATITLTAPELLEVNFEADFCNAPYVVTAIGGGGNPPYKYKWEHTQDGATVSFPEPGTYCVTMTDNTIGNPCGIQACIEIPGNLPNLELNLEASDITCFDFNDGTISAVPSGGQSPYSFLWSNGATTQTIEQLNPGTYGVTLTDDRGCQVTASGTVQNPPPLSASISGTNPECVGDTNGSATITATGGTPPLSIEWNTGSINSTITGLSEGDYSVTITDQNGCDIIRNVTLVPNSRIALNVSAVNESCRDAEDGSITSSVTGGVAPYDFLWSNGATTANIQDLAPGTYQVTVTDDLGCSAIAGAIVLEAPDLLITVNSTDLTSCGTNDGTASVIVDTGETPLTYLWSNNETTSTISDLTAGNYTVTVTDANGCTVSGSATITEPPSLEIGISGTTQLCPGNTDGVLNVTYDGGTTPMNILWSTGESTTSIENLGPGTYSVTVTDEMGCQDIASAIIESAPSISVIVEGTTIVCGNGSLGSATAQVTGGVAPFSYSWSNSALTSSIDNLTDGVYTVTVTDANQCEASGSISIDIVDDLTVSLNIQPILCTGINDGSIQAVVTGGKSPYTYIWSNGNTTNQIINLSPGNYAVTVTDDNGCTLSGATELTTPSPIALSISATDAACNGVPDGTASVVASGGTPPYTYLWSNNATSASIDNLLSGDYTVTVTDDNGCQESGTVKVDQPTALGLSFDAVRNVCHGDQDGSATVTISNGTPPYVINWSTGASTNTISNLGAGSYSVTVEDNNDCSITGTIVINDPPDLILTINTLSETCEGEDSGALEVAIQGGAPPYSVEWNTGSFASTIADLAPGDYTVTVTDDEGCTDEATATINEFDAPICNIEVVNFVMNGNDGELRANVTGGTGPFTYLWSNGSTTQTISNLNNGNYSVTVTDDNGCETNCAINLIVLSSLGNFVWEDFNKNGVQDADEQGISGVTIKLKDENGIVIDETVTDENGFYSFLELMPGTYSTMIVLPDGFDYTLANQGGDDAKDSDADISTNGMTANVTLDAGERNNTLDFGIYANSFSGIPGSRCNCLDNATFAGNGQFTETVEITSYPGESWSIISANGVYTIDSPEPPLSPVPISIPASLSEVEEGSYQFPFIIVDGSTFEMVVSNGIDEITVSYVCNYPGLMITGLSENLCITDEPIDLSFTASVDGIVEWYLDNNTPLDGTLDPSSLTLGTYAVIAELAPDDDEACVARVVQTVNITEDCYAKIGDKVWFDTDRDGIQDSEEDGIEGVKVIVTTPNAPSFMLMTETDANGMYMFSVPPGRNYKVTFEASDDLIATDSNQGSNDALDSDANPATGMSPQFFVADNEVNFTIDAGFYSECVNVTDAGRIGVPQMLCAPGNDPAPFTSIRPAQGGDGTLEYLWMKSTTPGAFNPTTWIPIPNSNSTTYDSGPLFETTYFARCARREGCTVFLETNILLVEVDDQVVPEIVAPKSICVGATVMFTSEGHQEDAQISWYFGEGAQPASATGEMVEVTFNEFGLYQVRLSVTENGCTGTTQKLFSVSNSPSVCGNNIVIDAQSIDGEAVMLKWEMEDLFEYQYRIEHSNDGLQFSEIGMVDAPVEEDGYQMSYEFLDVTPKRGYNYYRLKIMEPEDVFSYSSTEEILLMETASRTMIYPNPVKDQLFLEIFDSYNEAVTIEIIDINGRPKQTLEVENGKTVEKLHFDTYPPGIYFMKISFGDRTGEVIKILKR